MKCVRRELTFDLDKKNDKLHLLLGLAKIYLDIDKVIKIIRNTEKDEEVITNLMNGFDIDQIQAEGYPCGACLCAYHTQYHHRQSGHFNELLFHNRVFSICLLLRASVWPSVYRDTGKSNSVQ